MFDTEKFILEVQNRVCLWDSREKCYSDRTAKRRAWEEIAKLFYASWEDDIERKQQEIVEELQKKWKHLRDYHVKEKKQENTRSGSAAPKKRKSSYIDLLRFLNVVKESRISSGNISALVVGDSNNGSTENTCDEPSTNTNLQQTTNESSPSSQTDAAPGTSQTSRKSKMTTFQQNLISMINNKQQPPKEDDFDTKFLLSLLPEIKRLNERQKHKKNKLYNTNPRSSSSNFNERQEEAGEQSTENSVQDLEESELTHSTAYENETSCSSEENPIQSTTKNAPSARPYKRSLIKCVSLLIDQHFKKPKSNQNNDRNDSFGENVGLKMRDITDKTQRLLVEKIINDALFMAETGQLTMSHSIHCFNDDTSSMYNQSGLPIKCETANID